MRQINSPHNEIFKNLKQLATSAKHRRLAGQTLLEGVHLCQGFLESGQLPELCVYTDNALESSEVRQIVEKCEAKLVESVLLGETNFRAISGVKNGIGIMFVVDVLALEAPENVEKSSLLLEDIQDPGNLGTILRTAAAAGVGQVFLSSGSASAWSPKTLRAGMGAHFALNIYENIDLENLITNSKIPVIATSLDATKTIYEQDLSGPAAWIFGNEGAGVSEKLLSLKVEKLIIPQNPEVESLNVAASAAICLFEQLRQREF